MPKGGKRDNAGRPVGSLRPSGKKPRNFRLTDEEYEEVKEFIKQLREQNTQATQQDDSQ